jgi:hypothetical protein
MRALGLVAALASATGCVRLDPPSSFACGSAADCPRGDRCSGGACLAPGQCLTAQDCVTPQLCDSHSRCVDPQCSTSDASACNGFVCRGGLCATSCTFSSDCQSNYNCDSISSTCQKQPQAIGGACTTGADCFMGVLCCGQTGAMVCGLCFPAGTTCLTASDCFSGFCCKDYLSPGTVGSPYSTSCHDTACSP